MQQIVIHNTEKKEIYEKKIMKLVPKGINAKKYYGKLKLKEDPIQIQKRLRNEWE